MSNRTFLGKVGMTPKGEWNNSTTYERLDVVSYEGSSYIAITQNRNSVPTDSNPNWMIGAKHGEFTEEQLEEFKEAVVAESKQEMDDYTADKKTELDTYEDIKEGELNTYTTTKKGEIDTHTTQKISDYNTNADTKTRAFNTNAETKTTNFNDNTTSKTNAYNQNAEDKTTAFNTNATNKQDTFDFNATQKTNAFNDNATSKTTDFNTNASDKTQDFDDNYTDKLDDFNQNAQQKTAEFDSHVAELEEDNENLRNALPEVTGEGSNIVLQGTSRNKYKTPPLPGGNSTQIQLTGKNKFDLKSFLTDRNVEYTENADGSLTFNTASKLYNTPFQFSEEDTTMSLSGIITNVTSAGARIQLVNEANVVVGHINETTTSITNMLASKIRLDWGTSGTVTIKNIMLNAGTVAEDYEPYCRTEYQALIQHINKIYTMYVVR